MGESPQSERRDGEARSAETEEAPHEPGERAAGNGTVHLRVRDADTPTTSLRLPADLPESSAALTDPRPTPRDEPAPESETAEDETAEDETAEDETAEPDGTEEPDGEPAGEAPAPADPRRTMALRAAEAKAEPTMMLRLPTAPEEPAEAEAGSEEEPESEPEGVPAGPQPTMTLRMSDLAAAEKAKPKEKAEAEAEEPAKADVEDAASAAKPEPTMTLRVEKDRPERTVMLRLPKEAAEPAAGPEAKTKPLPAPTAKPAPEPEPAAAPEARTEPVPAAKPEARTKPLPAPAPVAAPVQPPAQAPVPVPAAEAAAGPESTIEALEVLKALSARPMTPLRRALKRITIWGVFLAVVVGVLVAAQLLRPLPTPAAKLSLADSFTFGGEQPNIPWPAKGQAAAEVVGVGPLGGSGEEKPVPIASVTKVMNAYLILQAHPLKKGESGPTLTVDKQAAQESGNADESTVTLKEGQQLSEYEALEMLMLPSANNVARLLARWDSGSEEEFVKKMNATAAQLGMPNTTYADPAGYDNNTKSTAKDQLKLAEKVMQLEIFKQIVAEPDTKFNGQRVFNTNALLGKNGNIGVKTGSSTPAQSCLMWAAVKEIGGVQRMILGVTLGQPQTKEEMSLVRAAQPPSQRINVAAQAALAGQTLAKQGDVVGYVDDGVGGRVPLVAAKDLTVAGWNGVTAKVTLAPVGTIAHTLAAGTRIGTLAAGEGDGRVEVPVTLQKDLAPASISARLLRLG
ncbi:MULTISPECIES: serine hydrolase [Kitasatospora]|uniref:Putative peptidase S11 family protein n=1 Tax=Kitasatospora setae (strain ATCC 33774 / DSM 43861 / JCM 3304 / KCC A-0304 / NBRC 14216 / KM-6054) TaxID=452652 RepID=E4NFP6_KITSK|nr:serine hydrolase [Kitasatospora setae]BAJ30326.1 putative peptidase S11 family protein [Kitasatospora setae KM-6054]